MSPLQTKAHTPHRLVYLYNAHTIISNECTKKVRVFSLHCTSAPVMCFDSTRCQLQNELHLLSSTQGAMYGRVRPGSLTAPWQPWPGAVFPDGFLGQAFQCRNIDLDKAGKDHRTPSPTADPSPLCPPNMSHSTTSPWLLNITRDGDSTTSWATCANTSSF